MLTANKLGALGTLLADALDAALGDLSPSAAALLLTLHHHPDVIATELAAIAGVAQPTAVRLLDGLARQGLITRGARQGRTTPLGLTKSGAARAQALQQARLAALARLLEAIPPPDRPAFERSLDALLAGATTSRRFARTTCRLCDHRLCDGPACPIGRRATDLEHGDADRA